MPMSGIYSDGGADARSPALLLHVTNPPAVAIDCTMLPPVLSAKPRELLVLRCVACARTTLHCRTLACSQGKNRGLWSMHQKDACPVSIIMFTLR